VSDDWSQPRILEEVVRLVGADPRFHVRQNQSRLGFYHNFEHCLALVPAGVEFIALSDHDDCWHPNKLDSLLAAFDDQTTLVYSDMNIVDQTGKQLATTYWTNRRNNYQRLGSLFLANTITGAAAMFRRRLLDDLLPFPDKIGLAFHDHWIGCTALSLGRLKFIDRPLYDYVQHDANVIGHYIPPRRLGLNTLVRLVKVILPFNLKTRLLAHRARAKAIYMNDVLRIQHIAQILEMRCGDRIPRQNRRTVRRFARLDASFLTVLWPLFRSLIGFRRQTAAMGAPHPVL